MSICSIVRESFDHHIDCFCPSQDHYEVFHFKRGDLVEVTEESKYMMEMGWYFLLRINNQDSYYISIHDIESYYEDKKLSSILDLELEINHLEYKVDQALILNEEEQFHISVTKLIPLKELFSEVIKRVNRQNKRMLENNKN